MNKNVSISEQELMNWPVDDVPRTTYAEHKKTCAHGCAVCSYLRAVEKELHRKTTPQQVAHEIQEDSEKIINYYRDPNAILTNNGGRLNRKVYLVLQVAGFTDKQIRTHYHINTNKWTIFKKKEFPEWDDKKAREDLLAYEGLEDYKEWQKSPDNTQIRHVPITKTI